MDFVYGRIQHGGCLLSLSTVVERLYDMSPYNPTLVVQNWTILPTESRKSNQHPADRTINKLLGSTHQTSRSILPGFLGEIDREGSSLRHVPMVVGGGE